jgi:hypothetical protein
MLVALTTLQGAVGPESNREQRVVTAAAAMVERATALKVLTVLQTLAAAAAVLGTPMREIMVVLES